MTNTRRVISIIVTMVLFSFVGAADMGLGIKSAIVPGMGQLSAGEGNLMSKNTLKGLGFMAGFVICLNGVVSEAGAMDSYAQQTSRLNELYNKASNYEEKDEYARKHQAAWDNYESSKIMVIVFTGLTALVYGYNLADAMLFTVSDDKAVSKIDKNVSLGLACQSGVPSLKINCRF